MAAEKVTMLSLTQVRERAKQKLIRKYQEDIDSRQSTINDLEIEIVMLSFEDQIDTAMNGGVAMGNRNDEKELALRKKIDGLDDELNVVKARLIVLEKI